MIAVDTNVVVRFLVNDDTVQFDIAKSLVAKNVIAVPHTVLLETEWVLRRSYGFVREQIVGALTALLGIETVTCANSEAVGKAIDAFAHGCDFADAMHAATADAAATEFVTFDKTFARQARTLDGVLPVRLLEAT